MENDLRYQVRSREIVDLVSAMRAGRLTLSPYFQRNLVWRDTHKRDFIDTILKGYPFPQIFLARGPIDLETMAAVQCVVDGQQRLNAILEFISGRLHVENKIFQNLSIKEKEHFLKYEVPVIDFDLDAGDPRLKEVFHRLNRTYYSLSAIEKISSEYSASEFLLVGRVLCGEITGSDSEEDELQNDVPADNQELDEPLPPNRFDRDPGIDDETWKWLQEHADGPYTTLIAEKNVFTGFEFDRKIPLMFTLNVMCTYLTGYFNRNDRVRKLLEDKNSEFLEKDELIEKINSAATFIQKLDLPIDTMWWNKANFFSLLCEVSRSSHVQSGEPGPIRDRLLKFANSVPNDYALAAREATGRKNQRELRASAIRGLLLGQ